MRIFNHDGSEVEACGNATRAVALLHGSAAQIETAGGMLAIQPSDGGAAVDMGEPRFEWDAIPLAYAMDTLALPVGWEIWSSRRRSTSATRTRCSSSRIATQWNSTGSALGSSAIRCSRSGSMSTSPRSKPAIDPLAGLGTRRGPTRACGTGACATAVAAMRRGLVEPEVTVTLPGGALLIAWGEDNRVT